MEDAITLKTRIRGCNVHATNSTRNTMGQVQSLYNV